MNRKILKTIASGTFVLVAVLSAGWQIQAQYAKAKDKTYNSIAPIDQYLMPDRNAEIALARTAAPESIGRDAEVLVLGRNGYEAAVKGKNGFVCLVERSWMMSKQQFFSRKVGNATPHLMFWLPQQDHVDWGADSQDSPVDVHQYSPQPVTEFSIDVSKWSDGTPADAH